METPRARVRQLRLVVEADDYDAAVRFYRDVLGMTELAAFAEGGDDRVAILEAGAATLEIASPAHKVTIDRVEGVAEETPGLRVAFQVDDAAAVVDDLAAAGARVIAAPVLTPWHSMNARLDAPAGLHITVFQETLDRHERTRQEGFTTDDRR